MRGAWGGTTSCCITADLVQRSVHHQAPTFKRPYTNLCLSEPNFMSPRNLNSMMSSSPQICWLNFFGLLSFIDYYSTTLHLTIISRDVPMNLSVEKWISFLGTGFKCSVRSGSADIAATQCDSHCSIVIPCTCLLHFGHQMHQQQPQPEPPWDLSQCGCGQ